MGGFQEELICQLRPDGVMRVVQTKLCKRHVRLRTVRGGGAEDEEMKSPMGREIIRKLKDTLYAQDISE